MAFLDSNPPLYGANQAEEYIRLLLDCAAEGVYGLDKEGRCTFANRSCLRLLGFTSESELLGKTMHELIHHTRADGKPYPQAECTIYKAFDEVREIHVGEEVFWRKDGTSFRVEYWSYPVYRDEQILGAVVSFLDITERKLAEEVLLDSEERYRTIVENEPECVKIVTQDGLLMEINPAGLAMLETEDLEGLLGKSLLPFVRTEYREPFQTFLKQVAEGKRSVLQFQMEGLKGTVRRMETIASPLLPRKGGPTLVLCLTRDVTKRAQLEEQLRQAHKMEAVGQLAGGVAHDFNNLLGVIIGYSDMLAQALEADPQKTAQINQIRHAAQRGAGLTRQLLAFSRQQVLEPRMLDLNEIVRNIETMLRRLIGEDIEFHCVLRRGIGSVKADPGQIEQVIVNLVVNARDAMPKGGKLTLETGRVDLEEEDAGESMIRPGSYVHFTISDNGEGMDEKTRSRIFEPFFTTKEQGKGTGLGLSTVYGIVKQSDGHIFVHSEPGEGTTFKIYLPRLDARPDEDGIARQEPKQFRGSETVLLVEDEAALRGLTRQILEASGYTVLEAGSGARALELANRHKGQLHLLLTDVVMPGMSGRELQAALAAEHPETRVLFVSGYTDDAIVHHGILEAEVAFLQKPYTPSVLVRKIREVLDQ